jgi:hypothetical protein
VFVAAAVVDVAAGVIVVVVVLTLTVGAAGGVALGVVANGSVVVDCVVFACGAGIGAAGTRSKTFSGGASVAAEMVDVSNRLITV